LDYVLAGWLAATVRAVWTRVMNTCYCVVSRFLFLPPLTRNFMTTSDDRVFTNIEHHISYTGFVSVTVIRRVSGLW